LTDFLPINVIVFNARQRGTVLDGTIRHKLGALFAVDVNVGAEWLSPVVLIWFGVGVLVNLGVHLSGILRVGVVGTQGHALLEYADVL
jgi:hypothetical protein